MREGSDIFLEERKIYFDSANQEKEGGGDEKIWRKRVDRGRGDARETTPRALEKLAFLGRK